MVLAAALIAPSGSAWQLKIDNCRTVGHPGEAAFKRLETDSKGVRHFRIKFANRDDELKSVFVEAMARWNDWTWQTKVRFVESPGAYDVIIEAGGPDAGANENACANYEGWERRIWYSTTVPWKALIAIDRKAAVRIMAHELGHVLYLDHKFVERSIMRTKRGSVMRPGKLNTECEMIGREILSEISAADAKDAAFCVALSGREMTMPRRK